MDKKSLFERVIGTKNITPALRQSGWDKIAQIREEVRFTTGRIIVRGKLVTRGQAKRADCVLYLKSNISIALIEGQSRTGRISFAGGTLGALYEALAPTEHSLEAAQ